MKTTLNIIFLLSLIFVLSSCFTSTSDIQSVKDDLIGNKTETTEDNTTNTGEQEEVEKTNEEKFEENISKFEQAEENISKIQIEYLDENKFIELDSLETKDLESKKVEITGKTLANIDKIIVNFSNVESSFPEDNYTLQSFNAGDKTFLYRAFEEYEVIDNGTNVYLIEAYSGDNVSRLRLTLIVGTEEKIETEEKTISRDLDIEEVNASDLPKSGVYGNPISLGNDKVAYSDIKGLEIDTASNYDLELDSDSVTSFLAENADGWFFWNTLRPIKGDDGVSFFVIRVDSETYYYEKYYYIPSKGILGVLELEFGTGIDTAELADKNNEFKDKNEDYQLVSITDILFKELID